MLSPVIIITALLFPTQTFAKTAGQLCSGTAVKAADGNWYCSRVRAITYRNISQSGAYNRTTGVDPNTGLCSHERISYSGTDGFSPLIGQLSMHLRGPMNVSQIAVYTLQGTVSSRSGRVAVASEDKKWVDNHREPLPRRNKRQRSPMGTDTETTNVQQLIAQQTIGTYSPSPSDGVGNSVSSTAACLLEPYTVTTASTTVYATATDISSTANDLQTASNSAYSRLTSDRINPPPNSTTAYIPTSFPMNSTRVVSTLNLPTYTSYTSTTRTTISPTTVSTTFQPPKVSRPIPHPPNRPPFQPTPSTLITIARRATDTPTPPQEVNAAAAAWRRVAYYTSTAPAQATGLAFFANLGDDRQSGTFDYAFGNSLSFVTSDGRRVAPQITPFNGGLRTSEIELGVFTDRPCDENCESWRPMTEAFYGWAGADKAFFIEFQMDHYDNTGSDQGLLSDAPALWFLNAAIPRTLQYGNDRNNIPCSCWSTGCGEFDAFEVLGRGEERAKSTIHRQGNLQGGDSNYFARPVGRMLKFAVIFKGYNITVAELPSDFSFSETLGEDVINRIVAYDPNSNDHSLFAIGS